MAKKKLIAAGILTVGIVTGIIAYIKVSGQDGSVETVAQVESMETVVQDETGEEEEKEKEEDLLDTDFVVEAAKGLAGVSVDLTDLYAHAVVETESEEEEEYIQSLAEEGEELENLEVEDMEGDMYAVQNVNLRKGTYVTTEALRLVGYGEQVKVTGITVDKQWYRVNDIEKGVGFIASSYLSTEKPVQNQSTIQTASSDTKKSSDSNGDTVDSQSTQASAINESELSPEAQAFMAYAREQAAKGPEAQTGTLPMAGTLNGGTGLYLNK